MNTIQLLAEAAREIRMLRDVIRIQEAKLWGIETAAAMVRAEIPAQPSIPMGVDLAWQIDQELQNTKGDQ